MNGTDGDFPLMEKRGAERMTRDDVTGACVNVDVSATGAKELTKAISK